MAVKSRPLEEDVGMLACVPVQGIHYGGMGKGDGPDEPDQSFGCSVLLGLEFVADEVLKGRGLEGGYQLSVPDFLGGGQRGWMCRLG